MPLTAIFNTKGQMLGVGHANRDAGGAIQLPETLTETVSPAAGIVPTGLATDFRAGAYRLGVVFGTGDNADRGPNAGAGYAPEAS